MKPLLCPKCGSQYANKIAPIVQPWKMPWGIVNFRLGTVYGCWRCKLSYSVMNDGAVKPLSREAEPPQERNGTEPKKVDMDLVRQLRNMIKDPDAPFDVGA